MRRSFSFLLLSAILIPLRISNAQAPQLANQPRLVEQVGHAGEINAIALTPNEKYVVTGSKDASVRLWDAATGKELQRFADPNGWINVLALSRDGRHVLYGGLNGVARLAETETGKEISRFDPRGRGELVSVAFSPDETTVLTGSRYGTVILWDLKTGQEVRRIEAHDRLMSAAAYSPNGKFLLTGGSDKTAKLWDAATGRELRRIQGHTADVEAVAFSPDGRYVITGSSDQTARVWATQRLLPIGAGKELHNLQHPTWVQGVAFSPDGKELITLGLDRRARFWDANTGKMLREIKSVKSLAFSPDGRKFVTGSGEFVGKQQAILWEAASGKELQRFEPEAVPIASVAVSPDGQRLLIGCEENAVLLLDAVTGKELRRFEGHAGWIQVAIFSPDGRQALTASTGTAARLWEIETGKEVRRFEGHGGAVTSAAISSDGQRVLTGSTDKTARYWDASTGKELQRLSGHTRDIRAVALSPDGKQALTGGKDMTSRLWRLETGEELQRLQGYQFEVCSVAFSANGQQALTGTSFAVAQLWDLATGKEIRRYRSDQSGLKASFSPDGKRILTAGWDHTARIYDYESGKELLVLQGHSGMVESATFTPDGKRIVTGSLDNSTRIWDAVTGRELCRLLNFRDGTWSVIDAEGRFDAANAGDVAGIHWVVRNEPIALHQLKERYFDPGLLPKYLGFKKEPLRDVAAFKEVKLFPEVKLEGPTPDKPELGIRLINRGGGIGRVIVRVNGKELTADARGLQPNPNAQSLDLKLDLANDPRLTPGKANTVEVLAFNGEGYLSSRGLKEVWEPRGKAKASSIELYAIVGGVSEYSDAALSLRFAAKDAEDMAAAIEAGAKRLFGAEKVHLTLLASSQKPRTIPPTKANFQKAFEEVRKNAKPEDVLVVYLAGHGVSLSRGSDLYCYATAEARNLDPAILADSALRAATTITSEELAEWTKQISSQKQVLILDTCAAGAAAAKLTEKRDVSGDQIRALDRLKDRTGFHVLLGCAADRVSYEASRFEQGLLTYSLLSGMRGAALRDDEFVDVSKLFQYSADRVPQLAKDIGGIQSPMIFAPRGTSFDVGQLKAEDKQAIPLATVKSLILRPLLLNPDEVADTLGLTPLLRKRLNEEGYSTRGGPAASLPIVFVDADEMPGAIQPVGTYTVAGADVRMKMNLRRDGKTVQAFEVAGKTTALDALTARIVEEIGRRAPGMEAGR